jgi:hypothetical protein
MMRCELIEGINGLIALFSDETAAHWVLLGGPGSGRYPAGSGGTDAAPSQTSVAEADARLEQGFTVKNSSGKEVRFGQRAKRYLETKPDGAERKKFLPWAEDTVRTTAPRAEGDRDVYEKVFRKPDGKDKGFTVLVSVKEGEVWDWYPKPASKLGGQP